VATTLSISPAGNEPPINQYPPEHIYARYGASGSIGLHIFVMIVVLIVAYINHMRTLRDLMSGKVAATLAPPPEIEVILDIDKIPPPPTNDPQFIIQKITPKIPPPPPPPPPPKKKPEQHPIVAHAAPRSANVVVGSSHFPQPYYPADCLRMHIQGTVLLHIIFDGTGHVADAQIDSSSGSSSLDEHAAHFIMDNWYDPAFAGESQTVPIEFQLSH
jgi:protein TonB